MSVMELPSLTEMIEMYEIIIDIGKPMTEHAETIADVRAVIEKVYDTYLKGKEDSPYVDIIITDEEGRDVTEDMVFQEMFSDMVEQDETSETVIS